MKKLTLQELKYQLPKEIRALPNEDIISLLETHDIEEFDGTECILITDNIVASPNLFCHPRLLESANPYFPSLFINEKSFIGQSIHIVPQQQCDEIEKGRNRQKSIENIFSNRFGHNSIRIPWTREDLNVYLGPGEADILITKMVDDNEVPAACRHYGVERYVVPEFRGEGLGVELVLIGAKTPSIRGFERGTGLYSPGGYASRKKAFDALVQEFGLSEDVDKNYDNVYDFYIDSKLRVSSGIEGIEYIVNNYLLDKVLDPDEREEISDEIVSGILFHEDDSEFTKPASYGYLTMTEAPSNNGKEIIVDDGQEFYISLDMTKHPKLMELAECYRPDIFQVTPVQDSENIKTPGPIGPGV